jgi:hypothetical protein
MTNEQIEAKIKELEGELKYLDNNECDEPDYLDKRDCLYWEIQDLKAQLIA